MQLFADADLAVCPGSDVEYRATMTTPRVDEVRILRPQEIPSTWPTASSTWASRPHWIEETGADVLSLGTLAYSKATANPIRVVLRGPRLGRHPGVGSARRLVAAPPSIPS